MKSGYLAPFLLILLAACNDPAVRTAELQTQLQTQVQESDLFTLDPQGPSFAGMPYSQSDSQNSNVCTLNFSVSSVLPETFFQSTEQTFTQHPVLDACVTQLGTTKDLGRLYFSKNTPVSGPPSHHSATSMSDFLHVAIGVDSTADAQAFLACMSSGLNDYFKLAKSHHGDSKSGYQAQETSDTIHVHYDLTVMTITSFVSQLVKIVEVDDQIFVVFTAGTDGNEADAETYSHTGVKASCQ